MLNRRQMLKALGLLAGAQIAPSLSVSSSLAAANGASKKKTGSSSKLVGGFVPHFPRQDPVAATAETAPGFIRTYDLKSGSTESIAIDFYPHDFCQHPSSPLIVASIAKWNERGAVVNFATKEVVAKLRSPDGYRFFGHALFHADGSLYASGTDNAEKAGVLFQIDPVNGKILRSFKTGGRMTHEFIFWEPDIVVTANCQRLDGPESILTWLNVKTGQIVRKENVDAVCHLDKLDQNTLMLGQIYTKASLNFFSTFDMKTLVKRNMGSASGFDPMKYWEGEGLSFCDLGNGILASTAAKSSALFIWDTNKNSFHVDRQKAFTNGLVRVGSELWMNRGDGWLVKFTLTKDAPYVTGFTKVVENLMNSSHMLHAMM